jgi:hypothetical protein
MSTNKLHNELYKLAIAMHKHNGRGVKRNLDLLLSQVQVRNNGHNNNVR